MSLRPFGHHSLGLTSVTNNSLFHQANTGSVFDQVSPAFSAIHLTNTCLLLGSGTYSLRCEVLLPMSTTCSAVQKWFCMMHSCLVASFAYPSFGQPWDSSQSFSTLNGSMASSFFSLFSRSQIGGELSYQSLFDSIPVCWSKVSWALSSAWSELSVRRRVGWPYPLWQEGAVGG